MYQVKARYYSELDNLGETYILVSDNQEKDRKIEVGEKVNIIKNGEDKLLEEKNELENFLIILSKEILDSNIHGECNNEILIGRAKTILELLNKGNLPPREDNTKLLEKINLLERTVETLANTFLEQEDNGEYIGNGINEVERMAELVNKVLG
jgi:hypothetical protein